MIERIALEEAQSRAAQAAPKHDEGDIDTDDDEDDPEEFSLWQSREMARIARYRLHCMSVQPELIRMHAFETASGAQIIQRDYQWSLR